MNFDGLDAGMGDYPPSLHGTIDAGMEPSMDPHLNPSLLQGVELDPEGLAVTVPEPVHLMEGMFSELHSAVSEVGIPVTATHFDLQEEMLWMGNHRVRVLSNAHGWKMHPYLVSMLFHLIPELVLCFLGTCNLVFWTYNGALFFFSSPCNRWHPTYSEFGNRRLVSFKV